MNKKVRVLVACEESQAVCIQFRNLGIEAYSCDIQECTGGHPEWHIQDDVFKVINDGWDAVISFPPCTDITLSGAKHFEKKRSDGRQEESLRFFFNVWQKSNCCENPMGVINGGNYISNHFPVLYQEMVKGGFPFKPTQVIQPYFFGDNSRKTTCLWLKGLPKLYYNKGNTLFWENEVVEPDIYYTKSGKSFSRDYMVALKSGSERGKLRSKTFPGIARAMATQWGEYLLNLR